MIEASWGYLGQCWLEDLIFLRIFGHVGAKMGILSSTWEVLGQFWEHFWRILGDGLESEKH